MPNITSMGPGWRILGAKIGLSPQSLHTNDTSAATWSHWIVTIYISNETFVNGVTLDTSLAKGLVTVAESSYPPNLTSHEMATNLMGPGEACSGSGVPGSPNYSTSSCSTIPSQIPYVIAQIRDTYLVVLKNPAYASFAIADENTNVVIYGSLNYSQTIAIANEMIP